MQTSERIASLSGVWAVDPPTPTPAPAEPKMGFRDWLLLIPDYDGRAYELEGFVEAVRHVATRLEERSLLLALGGKLRSRARLLFGHRLHRFAGIEDFLLALRTHCGLVGGEHRLLEELRCARQADDERLEEYALRVDRMASELRALYDEEADKRFVTDVALTSFRRGLRSEELEVCVGSCEPKNLDEATTAALSIERQTRWREKMLRPAEKPECSSYERKRRRR